MEIKNIQVICRGCDLPMKYEGENPKGYHLFRCEHCKPPANSSDQRGTRVGLIQDNKTTLLS